MTSDDLLIASLIRSLAITTEDVMVHAWRPTSREGTGTDQEHTASNSTPKMPDAAVMPRCVAARLLDLFMQAQQREDADDSSGATKLYEKLIQYTCRQTFLPSPMRPSRRHSARQQIS